MDTTLQPDDANLSQSAAPTIATVARRSFWGALMTRTLPSYSGDYEVGVVDIELPLSTGPQFFGAFTHTSAPSRPAGLALETVLFTMFYPTKKDPELAKERVIWFPNLKQTVDGFLRMGGIVGKFYRNCAYPLAAALIWGTTFPATRESEIAEPPPGKSQWPLIIFSHGVGTSRLMYSAICGELASRGYVVACIEHRDGTGPSSSIKMENGQTTIVDFVDWKDLYWPDLGEEQPKNDTHLRHVQLELRLAEVDEVIKVIKRISATREGGEKHVEQFSIVSPGWDWDKWKGKIAVNDGVVMMGHSLGGTTAIMAGADPRFSFSKICVQDPAVQRLEPWAPRTLSTTPFLSIHSKQYWNGMDGDLTRLKGVFETCVREKSAMFWIDGSTHPSFSDIFLLLPGFINRRLGLTTDPERVLMLTVDTTVKFLEGKLVVATDSAEKDIFRHDA